MHSSLQQFCKYASCIIIIIIIIIIGARGGGLRHYAANRQVAGSIPDGVGIFQ